MSKFLALCLVLLPTLSFAQQAPHGNGGAAWPLPGKVQAENFDNGGEGLAYHDIDTINTGGQYRTGGVDIQGTTDTGLGYNIAWTRPGEWLEYTTNTTTTGTYTLNLRVANHGTNAKLHVEIDGKNVTGTLVIPNTGDYQAWTTITKTGLPISSGAHLLRVYFESKATENAGVGNFNWLEFIKTSTTCTYSVTPTSLNFDAAGGIQTITVNAQAGCNWSAASDQSWAVPSPAVGSGPGNVAVNAAGNPDPTTRSATLVVATVTLQAFEAAGSGTTTISLCDQPVESTATVASGSAAKLLVCETGPAPNGWKVSVDLGSAGNYQQDVRDVGSQPAAGSANDAGQVPYYLPLVLPTAEGVYDVSTIAYNYNSTDGWAQTSSTNKVAVTVGSGGPPPPPPPPSVTDNFNRADGAPGASWTTVTGEGALTITSNRLTGSAGSNRSMWYNAASFSPDQYAQAKIYGVGGTSDYSGVGLTCRASSTARTLYHLTFTKDTANNVAISKHVAGVFTGIQLITKTWNDGDTARLECQGTSLRAYLNGVQLGVTSIDSSITAGSPGITFSSSMTSFAVDDFQAGDLP